MRSGSWLALLALSACSSTCGRSEELAELAARVGGEVERDEANSQGSWHEAELGTRFKVGDGLRTGAQSGAELALLPSGAAHVSPHSLVRFMATPPRDPNRHVALEAGELEVLAEQIDLEVHTPRAIAQVSRGSKVRLSMRDGREIFDLLVGRVVVAHAGIKRRLEAAHPLELNAKNELIALLPSAPDAATSAVALATLEPSPDANAADAESGIASDAGSAAPAESAQRESAPRGTALRLRAIESATLHVYPAPVDVFLPTSACGQSSELRVDGQPLALARDGAIAPLSAGGHRVRLTCADGTKREAHLMVKRDAARLELPRRAQSVRVEADGRRYTVRYQNLLPDLTFVWPSEPETGAFTLVVRSEKHELTRTIDRPEHILAGALLGEGEHKFWFRAQDGRSSKPTTLRLAFDNTARSAYLSLPIEGSPVHDGLLSVEGAALVASKVTVEEIPAKLDEQGRFREQVQIAPEQRTVSVRVEHPGSGVHYYLRRLR